MAIVLGLGVAGAAAAQTSAGGTSPSNATTPPPGVATAPPRPITGPAARMPSRSPAPPAVATGNAAPQAAAPVAGANSFTEAEARRRIEAHGYSNVTGLQKDAQAIWRGTAVKNGEPVGVALDDQGKVVTQ